MPRKLGEKEEAFLCPFCSAPYRELVPTGTVQVKCKYCGATVLVPPRLGGTLQRCLNHPETIAAGACNGCGENYCGDCLFFVPQESRQQLSKYAYFCTSCLERKGLKGWSKPNNATMGLGFSLIIASSPMFLASPFLGVALFFIGFVCVLGSFGEKTAFPTVRRVFEKMSDLNERIGNVKIAMSLQDVEALYNSISYPAYTTKGELNTRYSDDQLLEKYTQSGLSRKEAIFRIATEMRVEIRPGLHIPPTLDDALQEIRKEMEEAKLPESKELNEPQIKYPEDLLTKYRKLYPHNPEGYLKAHIYWKMKEGKTREQAIKELQDRINRTISK